MVKQKMARLNINILGISELKWTRMGKFHSDDHYSYYCGKKAFRGNGEPSQSKKKKVQNAVFGYIKNGKMISATFQGKPFSITVIQDYTLTTDAKEVEVDQVHDDLQEFLELPPKQMSFSSSVQFSSVAQSCLTLCDPMKCSTPSLPVHHQLLEFTQTHFHRVSDAIQPSHPLSSPSLPAPNPSQHQSLFQ